MRDIKFRAWNGTKMRGVDRNDYFSIRHDGVVSMQLPDIDFNPPLMQFTGLKDKNDVDIYESDIVESDFYLPHFKCIAQVKYSSIGNEAGFMFDDGEQDAYLYGNLKVIGNIHENPELLL